MIDLSQIEASPIDDRIKGMPGGLAPTALGEIGRQGWNLLREDLPLPLAVIRERTLAHNGDRMRHFLARSGAVIAPHGKTTMIPSSSSVRSTTGPGASPSARCSSFRRSAMPASAGW